MHLVRYARNLELLYEMPREVPLDVDGEPRRSREGLHALFGGDHDVLYESEAKSLLSAYGIPVSESRAGAFSR